ncbi:MAG: cation:proton antiporter [Verrucomicrobia bacterium]|nr:cation:proton antiporter [Verrucomicrobiota bacterium]
MHNATFLQDLAVVMLVAGLVTVAFRWFRQPVVLGYILAGVLVGPHVLPAPLITSEASIQTLAELGVVFLLFSLGLEFNFRKIRQIGLTAFIVAPLETGLMFFAGYEIGQAFGWKTMDSVYLGGVMMISSTTIITKTLTELGRHREKFAEVIFGILIAEDIIAILLIASLSGVGAGGGLELGAVLATVGRLSIFLVAAVVLGLLVVPRLLAFVGRFKNDETLLVTVLGLCFGLSLLAVKLKFSVGLGAFIIGAIIAEAEDIRKIERLTAPLRDMFSAVFFVAIGLLIEPELLREYALPVAVISATIIVGKILACSFGSFVAGYDRGVALRAGLGLAQIGEFSFIIAALGVTLGVTSHFLYSIAVTVSAVTAMLTPYLIRHADKLVRLHDRLAPRSLLNYQRDYSDWIQQFWGRRERSLPRQMIHKMLWQLGVNAALLAALFLAAVFLDRLDLAWLRDLPAWTGGRKTLLWLAAMLLSLPIFIAALRKLEALSMLLAELTVRGRHGRPQKTAIRTLVSNTILFTGIVVLGLLILLLSSALLPPWEVLLVLLVLAGVLAAVLKTFFIKIYSRAQIVIRDTLSRPPATLHMEPARPLPPLLEEVELLTLRIGADSGALGRTIQELRLRTLTGASAVVIKRGTETIINPNPDVRFQLHDEVLLLGSAEQLAEARQLLEGRHPAAN